MESLFVYQTGLCGAFIQAYLPIVGAGNNGAILHYNANNDQILSDELLLIDAGCEFWGYLFPFSFFFFLFFIYFILCFNSSFVKLSFLILNRYGSDVTRTYPVNGVFTPEQTLMYVNHFDHFLYFNNINIVIILFCKPNKM